MEITLGFIPVLIFKISYTANVHGAKIKFYSQSKMNFVDINQFWFVVFAHFTSAFRDFSHFISRDPFKFLLALTQIINIHMEMRIAKCDLYF